MKKTVIQKLKAFLIIVLVFCMTDFILSCKKKNQTEAIEAPQEVAEDKNDEETFYSPAEDDASWVEALLARVEEERIAEELASMEESLSEYQLEEEAQNEEVAFEDPTSENQPEENPAEEISPIEKFFEEAKEGRTLTGKNKQMSFFEFDNEILSPQHTDKGLVVVHSTDGNINRIFYDLNYKMVKKEEWSIKSAADAKLLKTEDFIYSTESNKVIQKDISTPSDFETILYNDNFSPVSAKKYALADEKKYIVMERKWDYDDKNQLITDDKKEYLYKNNDYKNTAEVLSKRYEYIYYDLAELEEGEESENSEDGKNEIPPDSKYYENNVLKMQNKYTAEKGSWYTWIYFDDIFSVKTYYEKEVRVYDEYYNAGKLMRKKVYDKMD